MGMETKILETLEFRVTIPSAYSFLVRTLQAGQHAINSKVGRLSCFILDCTLLSYSLLAYLPSQVAAAAVLIARRTVVTDGAAHPEEAWSPKLSKYTSYTEDQVIPVARAILKEKLCGSDSAVHKKHRGVAETALPLDL